MKKLPSLKFFLSLSVIILFASSLAISPAFAYQTWSPSVNITNTATTSADPTIAVDHSGGLHAVWSEAVSPEISEIYYATKPLNGSWSTPQKIFEPFMNSGTPWIAIDSQDTIHLVWNDGTFGFKRIYYSFKSLNGVWSEPVPISPPDNYSHFPSLVVDNQDTLYLVWSYTMWSPTLPQQNDIFYTFKPAGGSWSLPINISNTGTNSYTPAMAKDGSGNLYVIWQEGVSLDNYDIFFSQKIAGGEWSGPIDISNTPSGSTTPNWWPPRFASDAQGNFHVLWVEEFYDISGITKHGLFYLFKDSSGWSSIEKLSPTSSHVDITVDLAGTAHVVYPSQGAGLEIFYTSKPIGGSWSSATAISHVPADSFYPAITNDSLNLYVVFMNNSVGDGDIFFVTSKIPYKVTWLPPLSTQEIYTMHDGATLPVKFNLTNPDGSQARDAAVNVVITENATGTEWFSGPAVYDPTLPGYSAKVSTKDWPLGEYTISLVGDRLVHDATYGLVLVETGKGKGKQK